MGERKAGQRPAHQLGHELGGAELHQLRCPADDLHFAGGGAHGENPARTPQAALVGDPAFVKKPGRHFERNRQAVGGNDGFEMAADVLIEQPKVSSSRSWL